MYAYITIVSLMQRPVEGAFCILDPGKGIRGADASHYLYALFWFIIYFRCIRNFLHESHDLAVHVHLLYHFYKQPCGIS